jgi:hypothetical protein
MRHHATVLLRDLRHHDAVQVEEALSASFKADLLHSILRSDPLAPIANLRTQENVETSKQIASIKPNGTGARLSGESSVRRQGRSFKVSIIVGAAAVLAAVIVSQVVPATSDGPPSVAAAVLTQAATAAGDQPPVVLEPGQFLYSEIRTLQSVTWALGNNEPSWQFDTTQDETIQTWQAANGSGRELITYTGPPQFTTPASREGWVLSGEPSISPPTNTPSGQMDTTLIHTQPVGKGVPGNEGTPGETPPDDSSLPTDPDSLRQVIQHGGPGIPSSVAANVIDASSPAGTFGTAAEILETPATGISPALRSALFQVMASVPGVELLGRATDRVGRSGTEIASPINSGGFRYEIIINRSTGQVLQTQYVLVDPSQLPPVDQKYFGDTAGEAQGWTVYLGSGIVTSTSSAPASLQS